MPVTMSVTRLEKGGSGNASTTAPASTKTGFLQSISKDSPFYEDAQKILEDRRSKEESEKSKKGQQNAKYFSENIQPFVKTYDYVTGYIGNGIGNWSNQQKVNDYLGMYDSLSENYKKLQDAFVGNDYLRESMSEEDYKKTSEAMDAIGKALEDGASYVRQAGEVYGQFGNADEYNRHLQLSGMSSDELQKMVDALDAERAAKKQSMTTLTSSREQAKMLDQLEEERPAYEAERVLLTSYLNNAKYDEGVEKYGVDPKNMTYSEIMGIVDSQAAYRRNPDVYDFVRWFYDLEDDNYWYGKKAEEFVDGLDAHERYLYKTVADLLGTNGSVGVSVSGAAPARVSTTAKVDELIKEISERTGESEDVVKQNVQMAQWVFDAQNRAEQQEKISEYVGENAGNAVLANAGSVLINLPAGVAALLDQAGQAIDNKLSGTDAPVNPNTPGQTLLNVSNDIRDATRKQIEKKVSAKLPTGANLGVFAYDVLMSTADVVAQSLVGGVVGRGIGSALGLGADGINKAISATTGMIASSGAAANTVQESLEDGYSNGMAVARGAIVGAIESLVEAVQIDRLLKGLAGGDSAIKAVLKGALSEGTEEVVTNILTEDVVEFFFDNGPRISRLTAEYEAAGYSKEGALQKAALDVIGQDAETFVSAAITGAVFGGTEAAANRANDKANAKLAQDGINNRIGGIGEIEFLKAVNEEMNSAAEEFNRTHNDAQYKAVDDEVLRRIQYIQNVKEDVQKNSSLRNVIGESGIQQEIQKLDANEQTLSEIRSLIESGNYDVSYQAELILAKEEDLSRTTEEQAKSQRNVLKAAQTYLSAFGSEKKAVEAAKKTAAEENARATELSEERKRLTATLATADEAQKVEISRRLQEIGKEIKRTARNVNRAEKVEKALSDQYRSAINTALGGNEKQLAKKLTNVLGREVKVTYDDNAKGFSSMKTGKDTSTLTVNPELILRTENELRREVEASGGVYTGNKAKEKLVHEIAHAAARSDASFMPKAMDVYRLLVDNELITSEDVDEKATREAYESTLQEYMATESAKAEVRRLVEAGSTEADAVTAVREVYVGEELVAQMLEWMERASNGQLSREILGEKKNVFVQALNRIAEIFRSVAAKLKGVDNVNAAKTAGFADKIERFAREFAERGVAEMNEGKDGTSQESAGAAQSTDKARGDSGEGTEVSSESEASTGTQKEDERFSVGEIHNTVEEAIRNKGEIGEKYNQKKISLVPERLAKMVLEASGGKIDISNKYVALSGSEIYHEFKRHSDTSLEASRDQIALTQDEITEAVEAIFDPDVVESLFTTKDNPTQRQSFSYAKKAKGYYVVAEAVGGNRNPNIVPVLIIQVSESKWNRYIDAGKTIGEMLNENNPEMLAALDVSENKKNRVIAAQFVSDETIANTPHSPQFNDSISQNDPSVNRESVDERQSINISFARDINEWSKEGMPGGESFVLGMTGDVLQGLGAIENDIYMKGDKIRSILENHPEMSIDTIKRIPELLDDPLLVLASKGNGGRSTRVIVYGSVTAENGSPVLSVLDLRPVENRLVVDDMQKINSAYTKDNGIAFVETSNVLYADKKRTPHLLRTMGLQSRPIELQKGGFIGSITYKGQKVNITGVPFSDVFSYGSEDPSVNRESVDERQSLEVGGDKITPTSTDAERMRILSGKTIADPPQATGLPDGSEISSWEDIDSRFGKEKLTIIKKLVSEFGAFKEYENTDIDLSFEFSANNFRESYSKQGRSYKRFAKMFSVFDEVVEKAVGIEAHLRDDYKPDPTLRNMYVLVSAFADGDEFIPVKMEIKAFSDKKNKLYVAVSLDGIKKTEVWKQGNTASSVTQNSRSVIISIPDLMRNVKPSDVNFTKYFPKSMLTDEQRQALEESEDIRYSLNDDGERFTYSSLIAKPDMKLTQMTVPDSFVGATPTRADVVRAALNNARSKNNPKNSIESAYVRNNDTGNDILVNKDSIQHGLYRKYDRNAIASANIGDLLENAILINRHEARDGGSEGNVYLSAGQYGDDLYLCRIITDERNEVEDLEVMYALSTKKEPVAHYRLGIAGKPLSNTDSAISIADLLDIVKRYFADVLPKDVLREMGMARPQSSVSDSVRYSLTDEQRVKRMEEDKAFLDADFAKAERTSTVDERKELGADLIRRFNLDEATAPKKLRDMFLLLERYSSLASASDEAQEKSTAEAEAQSKNKRTYKIGDEAQKMEEVTSQIRQISRELIAESGGLDAELLLSENDAKGKEIIEEQANNLEMAAMLGYYAPVDENDTSNAYKARLSAIRKNMNLRMDRYIHRLARQADRITDLEDTAGGEKYRETIKKRTKAMRSMANNPNRKRFVEEGNRETVREITDWLDRVADATTAGGVGNLETELSADALAVMEKKLLSLNDVFDEDSVNLMKMLLQQMAVNRDSYLEKEVNRELAMGRLLKTEKNLAWMMYKALRDQNRMELNGREYVANYIAGDLIESLNNRRNVEKEFNTLETDEKGKIRSSSDSGKFLERLEKRTRKTRRWISLNTMDGYSFLRRMGDVGGYLYKTLRAAQSEQIMHVQEYVKTLQDKLLKDQENGAKGVDLSRYVGDKQKTVTVTLSNGDHYTMTAAQAMTIVTLYGREAGKSHIENGGVRLVHPKDKTLSAAVALEAADVAAIDQKLDEDDRRVMKVMNDFIREQCTEWGNEATLERYGFHRFNAQHYFPITVDRNALPSNVSAEGAKDYLQFNVQNVGFAKAADASAKAPVVIDSFINVINRHVEGMATYAAYLNAEDVVNRLMSAPGVKDAMQRSLGTGSVKYVTDMMTELKQGNRGGSEDALTQWWNKSAGHYKSAAVSYNLSTALKQPVSIIRAAAVLEPKYILAAKRIPFSGTGKAAHEEMMEYSGIGVKKSVGYSDVGVARDVNAQIGYEKKDLSKKARDISEFGMALAGYMDERTWDSIWIACREEVKDKKPDLAANHEALMRETAKRFADVVAQTQVVDSPLDSSPLSRSKSPLARNVFAFTSEPIKGFNLMMNAIDDLINAEKGSIRQKQAAAQMARTFVITVVGWAAEASISAAFQMIRDEDDDEGELAKEFGVKFGWQMLSNAYNALPYIGQLIDVVVDAWKGYDFTDMGIAPLVDVIDSAKSVMDTLRNPENKSETIAKAVRDLAESVATFFGIPIRNFNRDVLAAARLFFHGTDWYTAEYKMQKIFYNPKSSTAREKHEFNSLLTDAYLSGNKEAFAYIYNDMRSMGLSPQTIMNGIAKDAYAQDVTSTGTTLTRYTPGSDAWYIGMKGIFDRDLSEPDGLEKELTRLYKATEDAAVLPKYKSDSYTVNGELKKMSVKDHEAVLSEYSKLYYEIATVLRNSTAYKNADDTMKAYWMAQAERYAGAVSIYRVDSEYNLRTKWWEKMKDKPYYDVAGYIIKNLKPSKEDE